MRCSIEFIGKSGSGKSYLRNALEQKLIQQNYNCWTTKSVFYHKIWRYPGISLKEKMLVFQEVLSGNIQTYAESVWDKVFQEFESSYKEFVDFSVNCMKALEYNEEQQYLLNKWMIREGAGYILSIDTLCKDKDIFINDEAYLHRGSTTLGYNNYVPVDMVENYSNLMPASDIIIYVKNDSKVCLDNVNKRSSISPFSDHRAEINYLRYQYYDDYIEKLLPNINSDKKIFIVLGNDSVEKNTNIILSEIL